MLRKEFQTKKTFTRSEVENYTKKMLTSAELTMSEQKDRIIELKREQDGLKKQIEDLQAKNKLLQRGLNESERVNKQLSKDMAVQTKLTVNKVQQFGYKWKAYFRELFDEVEVLRDNASVELFASDIAELVASVIEATMLRSSSDETTVPVGAELVLSEDEWMDRRLKKLSEEPKYTLSTDSETKYKSVMNRLKSTMIYSSELSGDNKEASFDIQEALNPKDSLEKIIKDINN